MSLDTDHLICPTCGKGVEDLKNANLFRRHLVNHEKEKNTFMCEFCPKSFQTKQSLKAHIGVIHKNEKLKCDECDNDYGTAFALKRHKLSHKSTHDMAMSCIYCEKLFRDQKSLENHTKKCKKTASHKNFPSQKICFLLLIVLRNYSSSIKVSQVYLLIPTTKNLFQTS